MTLKFNNVYVQDTATITGPYEKKGPLTQYFDHTYDDLYFGEKTWEKAEIKIMGESIQKVLAKTNKKIEDIDLLVAGDLLNQIVISNYNAKDLNTALLGIYGACSSSCESMLVGAMALQNKEIKHCICTVSSHNSTAEKQYRNPVEYGAPRPKTATFTATGAGSILLGKEKTMIKIDSGTIGHVIDMGEKDANYMGSVMAGAAASTIYNHLTSLKRQPDYYDLIVTGDLGIYGKKILVDYMKLQYNMDINKNYDDCGVILYDTEKQNVYSGASGCATSALVMYSYLLKKLKSKEMKRILLVATGALMSPTMTNQKCSIPAVAHAISFEVVE